MAKDDVLFGYRQQLFAEAARTSVSAACRTFWGSPLHLLRVEAPGSTGTVLRCTGRVSVAGRRCLTRCRRC